jgi:hypothetical protein
MGDGVERDSAADRRAARRLVESVVLAQGNIFIRELLRRKKLRIGTKKEEFEANLLAAIEAGDLSLTDITDWLDEVEGWGDQHVYLYHLPDSYLADRSWRSAEEVKKRIPKADRELWNAVSLQFPETWTLTGIFHSGDTLQYVWHERIMTLLRKPRMDRREYIDGDWYQFRAHLERPDRAVMRLVFRFGKGIVAAFLQIPVEGSAHNDALSMIQKATKPILDWAELTPFSASDAIKNLDQAALENEAVAGVKSQKTRLTDAGNYIEFASTSQDAGYRQSAAVRSVRRAVRPENFAGNTGVFLYNARTPTKLARTVKIEIFGEQRRVRLWAQLKADEVWEILDLLRNAEQWKAKSQAGAR